MRWFAANKSKRFGECVFLGITPVWVFVMFLIVKTELYEGFTSSDYLSLSVCLMVPCWLLPVFLATEEEKVVPFFERYSIKANIWIAIVSYLGNHFFTHYFYTILGVRYTGPLAEGVQINSVPLSMYFMTHVYFLSYHTLATSLLRIVWDVLSPLPHILKVVTCVVFVVSLSIFTAFAETWTIGHFPYYTYPDFHTMLTYGSFFYSLFLVVTFPLFYRIDENPNEKYLIFQVVLEAFGAFMIVMLLADIWRLVFGNVYQFSLKTTIPYAVKD